MLKTNGVTVVTREIISFTEIERFWSMIDFSGDCWHYTGRIRLGYGRHRFTYLGERFEIAAHKFAYLVSFDNIKPGRVLDHECHSTSNCKGGDLCLHRRCVNPLHLGPTTQKENNNRRMARTV